MIEELKNTNSHELNRQTQIYLKICFLIFLFTRNVHDYDKTDISCYTSFFFMILTCEKGSVNILCLSVEFKACARNISYGIYFVYFQIVKGVLDSIKFPLCQISSLHYDTACSSFCVTPPPPFLSLSLFPIVNVNPFRTK